MIQETKISMGILLVLSMILTACGGASEIPTDAAPTETIIAVTSAEPTEEVAELVTEEPTVELTTLVAPNPTAVASGNTPEEAVIAANVAQADIVEGERLFNVALRPVCSECHTENSNARQRGPNLVDFSAVAGIRVEGQGAYTYAYNSIRYANQYIVEGYEPDVMRVYDGILTDQEVYDLIAYIWTLSEE